MTFIEELHQLKNSIQDFNNRYADYDCTILSDDDLREALYTDFLSGRLYTGLREEYEERADRYEIEYELKMQRLRERYHYLDPDEKKFRIGFLW